ncbi:hypothetical protein D6C90_00782 [Aureobasidium pullulans]|uniref:DNA (cytosine-5)-methyltransferase 1 replication foci domain-containing protein n=1 Tax=Aureobasidium pullulans TaxID=5580 RepID=A0A4S9DQB1_AURPU|nr:hypothetical protein D6D12_08577 [Aureobasidium pullulans]THX46829.1 hypothetical protein D6D11_06693 [Aureobasidium pullulans]THZ53036.1 hypothetical protein D6C90_00782 [Aureobasidium pullulans]
MEARFDAVPRLSRVRGFKEVALKPVVTVASSASLSFAVKVPEDASHLNHQHIDTIMSNESSILRPRDPSQLNSDEWPEFGLKNVFIFDPEDPNKEPVSLLHAGHYRPLSIIARLDPPNTRNHSSWLDTSLHRRVDIELTDIKEFSYGEYGDGSLDIWAAGKAGWFTIRPSPEYKRIYSDMIQALKLLYFMADSYRALKKYADLSAPYFFQKCSRARLEKCKTVTDTAAMFTKHRHFLIASMLTYKEGLQWTRTPLFTWFQDTFPSEVQLVRQRIKPPRPKSSSQKSGTQSPAPSTASSRRKKAEAKQQGATPKSTVSIRSARSTRSTRSQSNATVDSMPMIMDNTPIPEALPEVMSTPDQARIRADMSSSDDDIPGTGGKGKGTSALRPRPSKYIPTGTNNPHKESPAALHGKQGEPMDQQIESDVMMIDNPELETEESSDKQTEEVTEDSNEDEDDSETPTVDLPLHSQGPANEGDVWHCPVDGCNHKTYAASEPSSQILIKAHAQTHDFDHDERVQLVRRMEAPYLPVNRLMDRVREMAATSKFPPPITQRY